MQLQELRQISGHFNGGPAFVKDVDGYNGKKHQVLDQLLAQLGIPGTPLSTLTKTMGSPDEVIPEGHESIAALMPGPVLSGFAQVAVPPKNEVSLYAIYHWRGRHDYIWFLIDTEGKVAKSGWYIAGE
ncbi:UNVERIFIED_CONTAM: hypothetical protein HDU68_004333 [Siphonaria sp. JEL0065]|nr:hypothetical protein HDU68_004333 [Siphonaria sp. JEL0065]